MLANIDPALVERLVFSGNPGLGSCKCIHLAHTPDNYSLPNRIIRTLLKGVWTGGRLILREKYNLLCKLCVIHSDCQTGVHYNRTGPATFSHCRLGQRGRQWTILNQYSTKMSYLQDGVSEAVSDKHGILPQLLWNIVSHT